MKKIVMISLMAVAALGLMTSKAWSEDWDAYVNIVNSAETPVMLSLANNDHAGATFPGGGSSCILQPGQSTCLSATCNPDAAASLQWNIIYNFYDGTDNINQRISTEGYMSGPNVNCANPSQSGIFSVSEGTYVDAAFADYDVGNAMASWMGLKGTGEKVVGGLIDLLMDLAGYNPDSSEPANYYYSITIGQQDYNIDKLAGVGWDTGATPPPVTFIQGQQIYQYSQGGAWLSSDYLSNNATIAEFTSVNVSGTNVGQGSVQRLASVGSKAGQIALYDISGGTPLPVTVTTFSNASAVVQLSFNGLPWGPYVAAFGDSSVEYYNGTTAYVLQNNSWGSGILQMSVNWNASPIPQILVGLADGRVEYYNGTSWTELHNNSWGTSIMQLSAYWDVNNNLQAVAGLGNGSVQWWSSNSWVQLQDSSWGNPVYQLKATFYSSTEEPDVLVTLFNGAIYFFQYHYIPMGWTNLRPSDNNYCIIDLYDFDYSYGPTFLAGFRDGSVSLYDARGGWLPLQSATSNRVQFLSANWGNYNPTNQVLPYVYCSNYQFTSANGSNTVFVYPVIPNANPGDATIPDTIAVIGSNAFASCANLISVTIGKSVTNIGSSAFSNCTHLTQIYFRGNAPSLGTNVFSGDNHLIVYYLPGTTGWGATFGGRPTALWSPQIQSGAGFGVRSNRFGFDIVWAKASGMAVVVEACTNLTNPAWSPLVTNTLNSDMVYFSDSQWTNNRIRFYRLRIP